MIENNERFYNENLASPEKYSKRYSQEGFWSKLSKHYKSVGASLLESVMSLYYSFRDDETPNWAKRVILGALGYFIFPVDFLPDFVPAIGYSDDAAVILAALAAVALYIKPDHKEKAKNKVNSLLRKNK